MSTPKTSAPRCSCRKGDSVATATARVHLCRGAFDEAPMKCLRRAATLLPPGDAVRLCAGSWADGRGPPSCAREFMRRMAHDSRWSATDVVRLCQRSASGVAALCAAAVPRWLDVDRTVALCAGAASVAPAVCAEEAGEFDDPHTVVRLCRGVRSPAPGACAASVAATGFVPGGGKTRSLAPEYVLACRHNPLEPAELTVTDASKHCDVLTPNCTFAITVTVLDQYGHTFHGPGVTVRGRVKGGIISKVQLLGDSEAPAENGRAVFTHLRIQEAGQHTVAFKAMVDPDVVAAAARAFGGAAGASAGAGAGDALADVAERDGADGRRARPLPPHVTWDDLALGAFGYPDGADAEHAAWARSVKGDAAFWRGSGWRVVAAVDDDAYGEYVWIGPADEGAAIVKPPEKKRPPPPAWMQTDDTEGAAEPEGIIQAEIAVTVYGDGSEGLGREDLFRRGVDGLVDSEQGRCLFGIFSHLQCSWADGADPAVAAADGTSAVPMRFGLGALAGNCTSALDLSGVVVLGSPLGRQLWVQVGRRGTGWLLTHDLPSADMSHYQRLGVREGAPSRDIRRAYYDRSLEWHPDKWAQQPALVRERVAEAFTLVSEAYNALSSTHRGSHVGAEEP
mmetsp:Transcript_15874/g.55269  ORF Transcript_15874/g.55269 Transcript_15874/m.55269 type:complete len:622 (-) Transcript_15874:101-1966(-)